MKKHRNKYKEYINSHRKNCIKTNNCKSNTVTVIDEILTCNSNQLHYILYLESSVNSLLLVDNMLRKFSEEREKC